MTTAAEAVAAAFMLAASRVPTPLYEIPVQWHDVLEQMEAGDITPEEAEAMLGQIAGEFRHKALAAATVLTNYEAQAAASKGEADRLADRARRLQGRADWIRDYVLRNMQAIDGLTKIEGGIFTLAIRQNPPRVEVIEAAMVPREYERVKTVIEIDRRSILADFKASGVIPPGVSIERGERLEVR